MRAVDSAIALARENDWGLTVHWRQQRGILNCRFDRLFEPIPGIQLREIHGMPRGFDDSWRSRLVRWYNGGIAISRQESGALLSQGVDPRAWNAHKNIFIISYSRFHHNVHQYADFIPNADLRALVDVETRDFSRETIGVHIRRTDNTNSIEHSPLDRFEAAIRSELGKSERHRCYVASDSLETKEHLQRMFGDRVLCNMVQADRDSPAGVVQAAIELYALSRTQRIYGSYWSSFSHTAAHIGHIPEYTVLKDEFRLAQ
jgi:hypothetical protein